MKTLAILFALSAIAYGDCVSQAQIDRACAKRVQCVVQPACVVVQPVYIVQPVFGRVGCSGRGLLGIRGRMIDRQAMRSNRQAARQAARACG